MTNKIRFVQFVVQVMAVVDDGENLNPIELQPIVIRAAEWHKFAATGPDELLMKLQQQLDTQAAQTTTAPID